MRAPVVICSDGNSSHDIQSRAIARILWDNEPLLLHIDQRAASNGLSQPLLRLSLRLAGQNAKLSAAQAESVIAGSFSMHSRSLVDAAQRECASINQARRFVVATGAAGALAALAIARVLEARCVIAGRPHLLPLGMFDSVILLNQDYRGEAYHNRRILSTPLPLHYFDAERAQFLSAEFARQQALDKAERHWGVVVGGTTRDCPWAGDRILDALGALHGLARGENLRLLVMAGPKTPPHVRDWLLRHYGGSKFVTYLNTKVEEPLELTSAWCTFCERLFISADSSHEISAALSSGLRPILLPVRIGAIPGTYGETLRSLAGSVMRWITICEDAELLPDSISETETSPLPLNHWQRDLAGELLEELAPEL